MPHKRVLLPRCRTLQRVRCAVSTFWEHPGWEEPWPASECCPSQRVPQRGGLPRQGAALCRHALHTC